MALFLPRAKPRWKGTFLVGSGEMGMKLIIRDEENWYDGGEDEIGESQKKELLNSNTIQRMVGI